MQVLVVEDSITNRELVSSILAALGHTPTPAQNGQVAVDLCRSNAFDLVLMDIMMPEMSGFEALKVIRSSLNQHMPVVFLTGVNE